MKKLFTLAMLLSTALTFMSCGMGGNTLGGNSLSGSTAAGGNNLQGGGLLGGALSGQQGTTTSLLGNVLGNLLQLPTTQASLQGTWIYAQPKVIFESDNVLAKIGSAVASSKIESTLSTYLAKVGMTAGKSSFTFNADNTVIFTIGGRTTQGTYTYDAETKQLTLTGAFGLASLQCYAMVSATGELDMVFNANKLLTIGSKVASATSYGSTINSILSNFNGLKLGWSMKKN